MLRSCKSSKLHGSVSSVGREGLELVLAASGYLAVIVLLWLIFLTQIAAPLAETLSAGVASDGASVAAPIASLQS